MHLPCIISIIRVTYFGMNHRRFSSWMSVWYCISAQPSFPLSDVNWCVCCHRRFYSLPFWFGILMCTMFENRDVCSRNLLLLHPCQFILHKCIIYQYRELPISLVTLAAVGECLTNHSKIYSENAIDWTPVFRSLGKSLATRNDLTSFLNNFTLKGNGYQSFLARGQKCWSDDIGQTTHYKACKYMTDTFEMLIW